MFPEYAWFHQKWHIFGNWENRELLEYNSLLYIKPSEVVKLPFASKLRRPTVYISNVQEWVIVRRVNDLLGLSPLGLISRLLRGQVRPLLYIMRCINLIKQEIRRKKPSLLPAVGEASRPAFPAPFVALAAGPLSLSLSHEQDPRVL
jgi:hypothetical protein